MKFKKVRKLLTLGKRITIEKLEILKNGETRFSTVASFNGIDLTPDNYDNLQVCYIDPSKTKDSPHIGYRVGLADSDILKKVKKEDLIACGNSVANASYPKEVSTQDSGYCETCKSCGSKKNKEKIKSSAKKKEKKKDKVKK